MLKVNKLNAAVNVSELLDGYGFSNVDFGDYYMGDGIYEMMIGSRGELEEIWKNNEYYSKEELLEECARTAGLSTVYLREDDGSTGDFF